MCTRLLMLFLSASLLVISSVVGDDSSPAQDNNIAMLMERMEQGDLAFKARDYEMARDLFAETADMARMFGSNSILTEAYAMVARTYLIMGKDMIGRAMLAKSGDFAMKEEPLGWSRFLGVRGRFEWQSGELDKATATFKEMYEFCSTANLHERAIDAAHMVAITGSPEEQIAWGKKGIAEAEAGKVTGWLGPLWNNLGATYEDLGTYDQALEAYLKAREYHYLYGDDMNKLIADWAVGHAYRLSGDIKNARIWLDPLFKRCVDLNAGEFLGWTHKDYAEVELLDGHPELALEHLLKAEALLKKAGIQSWAPEDYNKLVVQIDELKKNAGE